MKIQFHNRDHSEWVGGDAVQLTNTAKALSDMGHHTSYSPIPEIVDNPDVVHLFHLNFPWTRDMWLECKRKKQPFVISAIYYPQPLGVSEDDMRSILEDAQRVVFLSDNEMRECCENLHIEQADNMVVIPNGVDTTIFKHYPVSILNRVISVGRTYDPMKGMGHLAIACKLLNIPLVCVGATENTDYVQKIRNLGATLIDHLSQEELAKELAQSRVYVCASFSERQSLGVLEAAACGCPIVDSVFNRGNQLLPSSVVVDPRDSMALRKAIETQMAAPRNEDEVLSWHDVATQLVERVYEPATSN